MTGQDHTAELAAQVERLERVARDLQEEGLTQEAVRELADEALITAERISQLLPAALEGEG
ncbi:MAG: hypothetical protein U0Y82_16875 [Thermoleophilia bacterium]